MRVDIGDVLAPVRDLGAFIRDQRVSAQLSLRQLARTAGVSNPYLSQVERGLRQPSAEILAQIARALQISVESVLTMAGILDEPDRAAPDVVAAIHADPVLSERQKVSLLEIYEAFRREADQRAPLLLDVHAHPDAAVSPAGVQLAAVPPAAVSPAAVPLAAEPPAAVPLPAVSPTIASHEGERHVVPV